MSEDPPEPDSRLARLVGQARARGALAQQRLTDLHERYGDHPAVDLGLRTYQRDRESAGSLVGAAVALRLFLFFVPLVLFVVGVAGVLSTWVDAADVNEGASLTGGVADQIRAAMSQTERSRWTATIVGLGGIAVTGRSLSKVLVAASCLTWALPVRTRASVRIVGCIVGLVVGIGLCAAIVNRIRDDLGLGAASASFLALFVVYGLAWMVVSTMLPRATTDPAALLPGSALVAATLAGMQAVSQLYLPDRLGRASHLYGALGATIVTLGWFFVAGRVIVLSMAINAVIYERFGSISQFVFALPGMRVLPRRSRRIRRFFDLDP